MQRWTAFALALVIGLMASVAAVAVYLVGQNRKALLEQFQTSQAQQVAEAARILDEDFRHIATDLAFVGELVQTTTKPDERQRNLAALLAVAKTYRRIDVFDRSGERILFVHSDQEEAPDVAEALAQTARESLQHPPGNIETTPPLELHDRRSVRVFATAFPAPSDPRPAGAVALLVDTDALFDKLRLVTSGQSSGLLLLGTHGRPTAASDPRIVQALHQLSAEPLDSGLRLLLDHMRAGENGTLLLSGQETSRYGLGGGDAVVAFASIPLKGGEHWALAKISPLLPVRRHERAILFRLIAATVAFSVCLAILGAYVVLASRRAVTLAERIRHADQLAYLHEKTNKLSTVGTLAAGIAHEIGTPLGVVRGRAEYLLGKLGERHQHQNSLLTIIHESDRVTRTIRQLLDFARVTPASIRPVQPGAAAQAVTELLRFEAERRKVSIAVSASDWLPPLAADPDQFQQVLVNLVMNACDACESGGRVLIAARGAEQTQSSGWRRIRIEVSDDGRGIPEEDRARVFDPFFTTKKRGEGTGLGLSIAAQIARDHGAEIELESELHQGTRVTLLWPVADFREKMNESAA